MRLSPSARPGDSIEQSMCRERSEEEERLIADSFAMRMILQAGAREIRLDPDYKPSDTD